MGNGTANGALDWLQAVTIGRKPGWTLIRIGVLLVLTYLALEYVVVLRKIESISMLPTFREGSIHVIYRLAYSPAHAPNRGDIVGVRTSGLTVMYVKRIIGLPGETIAIRDGQVLIDGQPLREPWVRQNPARWNLAPRRIEPGHYFVIGDNRSMSQDRHEFGAIEAGRIVGKVVW